MPATNQLRKISTLLEQISPLGHKARGMPINPEDWNTLVQVLTGMLEIDHAQEETAQSSLDQHFAPLQHEHVGQVTSSWLDPGVQASFAESGAGVSTRLELSDMDKKLSGLATQVARLTTLTEDIQRQLDTFSVNDVDRGKTLRAFDTRLAGVENLRTTLGGITTQFDGLKASVVSVLELRRSLTDAQGKAIDLSKIQESVTDLQGLRENLKGSDGKLVRVVDLQLRLKELSDAGGIGGPGGLEGRLSLLSNEVEGRLNGRIEAKTKDLRETLTAESKDNILKTRAELTATINKSGIALDQSLNGKIEAAEQRLNTQTAERVSGSITAVRAENLATVSGLLDQRFAGLPVQIKSEAVAAAREVGTGIRGELNTRLTDEVKTQTAGVNDRLNASLTANQAQMTTLRQDVQTNIKTAVEAARVSLNTTLNTAVAAQVTQARDAIEVTLDARAKSAVDAVTANLDSRIGASVETRLAGLDARVGQTVNLSLRNLSSQISDEVKTQFSAANIDGKIQETSIRATQQLRSEIGQAMADQQARTSTAVNDTVRLLRGEINVAAKNANDAAVKSATTLVTTLREETRTNMSRLDTVNTRRVVQPIR